MKKNIPTNEVSSDIYKKAKTPILISLTIALIGIIIGFVINFPLNNFIKNKVITSLNSSPSCPITYDSLKVKSLMPAVSLKNVKISGLCFKKPSAKISFEDVNVNLAGPSFSPLGIKLSATLLDGKTKLNITPSLSSSKSNFNIKESTIDSSFINKIMGISSVFSGLFILDANIGINKNKLSKSAFRLKSKNFIILSKTIKGFEIPRLDIKNLQLKASINQSSTLIIKELILGDSNSPLIAEAEGTVRLNQRNLGASTLNLEAKFKLSKGLDDLLLFFLSGKKKDAKGYYKVKLSGSLSRLKAPKFL